jgi:hypothetical protein
MGKIVTLPLLLAGISLKLAMRLTLDLLSPLIKIHQASEPYIYGLWLK